MVGPADATVGGRTHQNQLVAGGGGGQQQPTLEGHQVYGREVDSRRGVGPAGGQVPAGGNGGQHQFGGGGGVAGEDVRPATVDEELLVGGQQVTGRVTPAAGAGGSHQLVRPGDKGIVRPVVTHRKPATPGEPGGLKAEVGIRGDHTSPGDQITSAPVYPLAPNRPKASGRFGGGGVPEGHQVIAEGILLEVVEGLGGLLQHGYPAIEGGKGEEVGHEGQVVTVGRAAVANGKVPPA